MTCPTCQPLAATKRAQLDNRLRDVRDFQAGFQKCPQCGGTDWGTTEDFIQPTTAPLRAATSSKSEHNDSPDFMTILIVGLGILGIIVFFFKIMGATVHWSTLPPAGGIGRARGASFQLTGRKSYRHAASLDEATVAFRAEYESWQRERRS